MKEYRIAKCLDNGKINNYAIFKDGSQKKLIKKDIIYGKYFEVDNELNPDAKDFLRYSYRGRIKDAVDMIKNGNGDCITNIKLIGGIESVSVLYFLDREIGEELRQKTLDNWKNAKFGWAITCGYNNSFLGYSMVNNKAERITVFDKDQTPMIFDTKEAAYEYVKYLLDRSRHYAKKLANNLSGVTEENERRKIIDKVIKEIDDETKTEYSVITDFTSDMLTSNCELRIPECDLNEMGYEIIQYNIH